MRRVLFLGMLLLLLTGRAFGAEELLDAGEAERALPETAAELMEGRSEKDPGDLSSGILQIISRAAERSGGAIRTGMALCCQILAVVILTAVVRGTGGSLSGRAVSLAGALAVGGICAGRISGFFSQAADTVDAMAAFSGFLFSGLATLTAATGAAGTSGTLYGVTVLICGILTRAAQRLIVPGTACYMALSVADSAVEGGSVCLSMPVVAAKDGTLYVAYDDYLRDMTGLDGYLSGMSDGQIAEVKTKGGNDIVKLSDVFEKYGTDVNYVIEIRYANERNIMPFVETVKKAGVADVTSVSSYYFGALDIVENEFPDMPKIFLSENEVDLAEAQRSDTVDLISVNRDLMTAENLAAVHESGKKFGAWTLNSEEDIKSAVSMGLDSYFTDEGALAVSIEKDE